ncbi:unnamed protein product [Pocillopora meandrina]|uniref:Uncharacterized protein n=1 Tax=Pocillopora meandrina TaxID=46732 RepID=A0AAU9Y7D1_9CNID|nr:unnamed protein product [Pocillopora meandrina]
MSRRYNLSIDNIYAGNSPHANLLSTKTQLLSGADTSLQLLLPHNCITGSLDLHIPEWIWKKAGRILPQSNTIFPAPLRDSKIRTFSIMSERGSIPHFVQPPVHAQISNQNKYVEGALDKFMTWFKGQRIKGGLSSVVAINIDTRASGQKQGPKKQRKTRENIDFVPTMSSSFLDMATTSATSSLTSFAT